MALKYTYAFGRIIWNPHKFACERLSKITRKSFLETGNEQIKNHLLHYCKKENGKKSLFEKQINNLCDFQIEIDEFEITSKILGKNKNQNMVLIIDGENIKVHKEWTPDYVLVDKVFKIMADIFSLKMGCTVNFYKS